MSGHDNAITGMALGRGTALRFFPGQNVCGRRKGDIFLAAGAQRTCALIRNRPPAEAPCAPFRACKPFLALRSTGREAETHPKALPVSKEIDPIGGG